MKKFLFLDKIKWQTWALLFLILAGTFLRTYRFHDWLLFGDDQIRDAYITNDVVTGKSPLPLAGPFMSFSGNGRHSEKDSFHLGPIYYYFQIISAKFFGNYPDKLAYPDVFFSILLIPLFYLFLRIYFSKNLALGITGIYAISAYFIIYSRFAWNTNLIPFFVILFLLSLYKFLEKNEKTSWLWVLSLGFALGVGFQLHAIVMIIFSIVAFLVFLFSMKKNYLAWKKWVVVLLVFLALNAGQITKEMRTNFSNSEAFLHSVVSRDKDTPSVNAITLLKLGNDVDCHIEANFFLLSSYGDERCPHSFIGFLSDDWVASYFSNFQGRIDFMILFASLVFSVAGYFLLVYYGKKEKDIAKKYFLRLIILYFTVGFLVMLPLSQNNVNDFRYFVFGFFMPFMFLGFLAKYLTQKLKRRKYITAVVALIIFCLLIFSNVKAIYVKADSLLKGTATCLQHRAILGEIEPIAQDMISQANEQGWLYLEKSERSIPDAFGYLLKKQNVDLIKVDEGNYYMYNNVPIFYLDCKTQQKLSVGTILNTDNIDFDQSFERAP